jgi:hypothetical protein
VGNDRKGATTANFSGQVGHGSNSRKAAVQNRRLSLLRLGQLLKNGIASIIEEDQTLEKVEP